MQANQTGRPITKVAANCITYIRFKLGNIVGLGKDILIDGSGNIAALSRFFDDKMYF